MFPFFPTIINTMVYKPQAIYKYPFPFGIIAICSKSGIELTSGQFNNLSPTPLFPSETFETIYPLHLQKDLVKKPTITPNPRYLQNAPKNPFFRFTQSLAQYAFS